MTVDIVNAQHKDQGLDKDWIFKTKARIKDWHYAVKDNQGQGQHHWQKFQNSEKPDDGLRR